MGNMAQKDTTIHHFTITGSVDEDRKLFSDCFLESSIGQQHHYKLDMVNISKLNLVTLGLLAWLQETISSKGHSIEFVNAAVNMKKALKLYHLDKGNNGGR